MENMIDIIGSLITLLGAIFIFLGSLGIVRMPDSFNRMQTGTKASTLGTILTLLGLGIIVPSWFGKVFILIMFVMITNPVSSHTLARAAHFVGIKLSDKTVSDILADDEKNKKEE
ncbi:MAG TPA: monovalent cation/H(+) antiporter subunit G [Bacteroidales bacterium]|jgi:multicomponent Na+:H+ antiporter subunit G|nr:monovalent cation/H(+) antiporter subunit G [Bacteroidales bacterium]